MKNSSKKTIAAKALACVASAALATAMVPAAAIAGETGENEGSGIEQPEDQDDPGQEGQQGQESFTEVATAEELAKAVEAGGNIRLTADVEAELSIAKDCVIDLGGHTISTPDYAFDVYAGLELYNGHIKTTVDDNTCTIWLNQKAQVKIASDVTIERPAQGFAIGYWADCTAASLDFAGTINGGNGITVNGLITGETANTLLLDGAAINVAGHGIYQAGNATTSFTGQASTITAGSTGIEVRAGKLTVSNCSITGGEGFACNPNGNGTTTDGAGIAIAQHTTKLPIEVTIEGGTIAGAYSVYESNPQQNDVDSIAKVNLSITGGSFKGEVHSEDLTGFITGGSFDSDPSACIAQGYSATQTDGIYTVAAQETEPVAPVEPSEPSDPTEPSEPADPTEPSDPSDSTEPSEPTDPAETDQADEEQADDQDGSDQDDPSQPSAPASSTVIDSGSYIVDGIEVAGLASYGADADAAGNVVIPATVEIDGESYAVVSIEDEAFYGNEQVESVAIPSTVTTIGESAFKGCSNLESVSIPSSVTSIGDRAFSRCSSLTSVEIPASVQKVGKYTFYQCTNLANVEIDHSVQSIGYKAFARCTSLGAADVDAASIAKRAFQGCKQLKAVTLGDNVQSIGRAAFKNDVKLKTVTLGEDVQSIGKYAFNNTPKLSKLAIATDELTKNGVKGSLKKSSITKVVVDTGKDSANKKLANTYASYFTKANCGANVTVKAVS